MSKRSVVSPGSRAALKAWKTRRANALAQKRSAAARKAWRTRRRNERNSR